MAIVGEFWGFMKTHKKWWLGPIIFVLLLMMLLILIGGSPLGALVYPLL
jgi:hypothetical protein